MIAQLTIEDRDLGNERSVSDTLIEDRRCGPADLDEVLDQVEIEQELWHVLALRAEGGMPGPKERMKRRRVVAGPLNNPLIEAYERLYARLSKELNAAGDLYEKMALSQAARALINAIETESSSTVHMRNDEPRTR